MGLVSMIRNMIFTRPPGPEVLAARTLVNRISEHADAIRTSAEKYTRHRDPFAAMMADMYNRDQVSRIWRGNEPPT